MGAKIRYIKFGGGSGGSVLRSTAKIMKTESSPFITGDDGNTQRGRGVDWLTLEEVPVHNDGSPTLNTTTFRFTDEFGGQGFTSGIILDWASWDGVNINMWQNNFQLSAYTTLALATTTCTTFTLGGYSNWKMPNFNELTSVSMKRTNSFNYFPFNDTAVNILWTNTTISLTVSTSLRYDTFMFAQSAIAGNSGKPFPIRIGTIIGTTLS